MTSDTPLRQGSYGPAGPTARSGVLRLALILALGSLTGACERGGAGADEAAGGAPAPEIPAVVLDAEGREHATATAPTRIASLVPGVSSVLVELGEEARLVARTDDDLATELSALPSLGPALAPDLEGLGLVRPDLVIHRFDPTDPSVAETLDRLGLTRFPIRLDGVEDARAMLETLGYLTGRVATAQALLRETDEAIAFVREHTAAAPPVRAAFVLVGPPLRVAGPGTFPHELIRTGGGVNAFADLTEPYATVSPAELSARSVDVFLILAGTTLDPEIAGRAPIRTVGSGILSPGPRVGVAAYEVARALHPMTVP